MNKTINKRNKTPRLLFILLSLLAAFGLWAATQSRAYTVAADDQGASLVEQEDFDWTLPETTTATPSTCYYSDDKKFCIAEAELKRVTTGGVSSMTFNGHAGLGFKLKGGFTYRITMRFQAGTDKVRGLKIVQSPTFNKSLAGIKEFTANGSQMTVSCLIAPVESTTYWIKTLNGNNVPSLYELKVEKVVVNAITGGTGKGGSEFQWLGNTSTSLGSDVFGDGHLINIGDNKAPQTNNPIKINDTAYATYDFTDANNDYINFYIGPGSGTIRVYYNDPGTIQQETTTGTEMQDVPLTTKGNQFTTLLKKGESIADATTLTTTNDEKDTGWNVYKTVDYQFKNTDVVQYFATGGMIGGIEVYMDYDPTSLPAITEDFLWYGFGTALSMNPQGGHLAINHPTWGANNPAVTLRVNGEDNTPTNVLDPSAFPHQALVFRLAPKTRYRIQIFSDNSSNGQAILKTTADAASNYSLASAEYITSNVGKYRIKDNSGAETNTYIHTYTINNDANADLYVWVDPSTKTNIGGIQILPYIYKTNLQDGIGTISHDEAWLVDDNLYAHTINSNQGGTKDKVSGALEGTYYYVYGPSMVKNTLTQNVMPATSLSSATLTEATSHAVMFNKGNAIGLKLPAGARITVNFIADNAKDITLKLAKNHNTNTGTGANDARVLDSTTSIGTLNSAKNTTGSGPQYTLQFTNDSSVPANAGLEGGVQTVWIMGSNDYAYLSGFYVEIDPTKLQTITTNHLYPANEALSTALIDENHLKFVGTQQSANNTGMSYEIPTAPGADSHETYGQYYDLKGTDNIGFKLLAGKKGKINVYYYNSDELGDMGSGAAAYNATTRTITFPGTDVYADNMKGWWFGSSTSGTPLDLTGVEDKTLHLKFDTSTFPFTVVIQDTEGNGIYYPVPVSTNTADIDLAQNDIINTSSISQIYFHSETAGSVTILSALIGNDPPLTLYTGTSEDNPNTGRLEVTTRVSKSPYVLTNTSKTYIMTHRFNNTQSTDDVMYWLSGDVNVAAIEIIYFEDEVEPVTSLGYNGYIYVNHKDSKKTAPFSPREKYDHTDVLGTTLLQMTSGAKNSATSKDIMKFMAGTTKVYVFRNGEFKYAGVKWENQRNAANQGGYLDQYMTSYAGSHFQSSSTKADESDYGVAGEVNANPYTECNTMIGGPTTEDGGMFLQPIAGDFFRLEPEYDGVVTMWILQNGNTDGNTKNNGRLTRRPTYLVDENGRVMRRSGIKPAFDFKNSPSHYAINGTWVDLNTESAIRDDYSVAWNKAMEKWDSDWKNNTDNNEYGRRYKETMRMYDFWYDGGTYTNDYIGDNITLDNWIIKESANSDNSTLVTTGENASTQLQQNQQIGLIIYGSDSFRKLEDDLGFNNWKENKFSKYGYEVPVHVHVRYVFPVRAGKTYYLGGRGTKNDFMGVKFEPMPANYNHRDYIDQTSNYKVSDGPNKGKYILTAIADGDLSPVENRKKYESTKVESDYLPTYNNIPTIELTNTNSTEIDWDEYDDKTVTVSLKRAFKADNWYPIVLPFSVSESRLRAIFGADVKVLYLDPYEHTRQRHAIGNDDWVSVINEAVVTHKLKFTRHYYQMLYANVPAFICPGGKLPDNSKFDEIDEDDGVVFERVHIETTNLKEITVPLKGNTTHTFPAGYKIGEVGSFEYYVVGDYVATTNTLADNVEMYYMDNSEDTGNATVYHSHKGVAMKATRCWIVVVPKGTVGAPPRLNEICFGSFYDEELEVGNASSGIEDIVMDDTVIDMYDNDNVYDMMGRIVGRGSLDGLLPGVYIYHGQKHYIR